MANPAGRFECVYICIYIQSCFRGLEDRFVTDIVINGDHYSCHKIQINIMYFRRKSFAIS